MKENSYLTELTKKQNEELRKWSTELETYVQEQTIDLTYKNKELLEMNDTLTRNFREFIITISNLIELRDKECRKPLKQCGGHLRGDHRDPRAEWY